MEFHLERYVHDQLFAASLTLSLCARAPVIIALYCVVSCLYVLWNEDSNEERGWYRCTVAKHHSDGSSLLDYPDGQTETVNIQACE